ncbi:MAG: hypothetical protein IJ497_00815, partial [Clostridia bacterium]|nr:hypothetical protein [Clostridia bacterium]
IISSTGHVVGIRIPQNRRPVNNRVFADFSTDRGIIPWIVAENYPTDRGETEKSPRMRALSLADNVVFQLQQNIIIPALQWQRVWT